MARHKVYMFFQHNNGWQLQFLKEDLQTRAAPPMAFSDPAKIVAMAERGGALKDLASKQALDFAINMGRGSVWLMLTPEQHRKLTNKR